MCAFLHMCGHQGLEHCFCIWCIPIWEAYKGPALVPCILESLVFQGNLNLSVDRSMQRWDSGVVNSTHTSCFNCRPYNFKYKACRASMGKSPMAALDRASVLEAL